MGERARSPSPGHGARAGARAARYSTDAANAVRRDDWQKKMHRCAHVVAAATSREVQSCFPSWCSNYFLATDASCAKTERRVCVCMAVSLRMRMRMRVRVSVPVPVCAHTRA
jgi:hypothetical protein